MKDRLELTYELSSLPTAQHRAGLAGLLVLLDTMHGRRMTNVPEARVAPPNHVHLVLTPESLCAVLDELYDASIEEVETPTQRKGRSGEAVMPIRTVQRERTDRRTGKVTATTLYVYPQVVPKAAFLAALKMPETWLKLWREAIWSTLRGIPKTRLPYEQRAQGQSVTDVTKVWKDLQRIPAGDGRSFTTEIASSLFLGAQTRNADGVPFRGSPDQNLLLHFWPVVAGIGEARRVSWQDGQTKEVATGFVLAVPDVADIDAFRSDFPIATAQLSTEVAGHRGRPLDALVSLPQESALEYMRHLARLSHARALQGGTAFDVTGFDVYHLEKQGNNIRMHVFSRVPMDRLLLDGYERLRGGQYGHPLFKAQLLLNLLRHLPWYSGFSRIFATNDSGMFVGQSASSFVAAVSKRLRANMPAS